MRTEVQLDPISPADREEVVDLYNYYVTGSFAAFPEREVSYGFFDLLMEAADGYPALTARDVSGRLVGFGLLRPHHRLPAFARVAETTYFLAPDCTRQGVGSRILEELERQARARGIATLLAPISSLNEASIAFHLKHGFIETGRFRQIGEKMGQFFDVVWMQKML
jgi:L-amino acid N-acyltransferase YncA